MQCILQGIQYDWQIPSDDHLAVEATPVLTAFILLKISFPMTFRNMLPTQKIIAAMVEKILTEL
jgi:hypothetical protein